MISIVIPTWNRRKILEEAIDSIFKQTYKDFEIIIIDDASTDDTEGYIKNLDLENIIYKKNDRNLFAHNSRKEGYKLCSGEYIIFMDDDDYFIDDRFFDKVISSFSTYDNLSVVIGSTISFCDGKFGSTIDLGGSGFINQIDYINEFSKKYKKAIFNINCSI